MSPSEPRPEAAPDHGPNPGTGLSRRTVAICACIALIGALAAGLVATIVLGGDGDGPTNEASTESPSLELEPADEQGRTEAPEGDDLLTVALLTVDDRDTSLRELHDGRPMLVNLWAQSCAPCVKEMPWLESISQANPEVTLVGVNVLDRPEKAQEMVELTGITYPWVRDPKGEMSVAARSTSLPDTYLFDSDGTLVASKLGAFASEEAIQTWLDVNLG